MLIFLPCVERADNPRMKKKKRKPVADVVRPIAAVSVPVEVDDGEWDESGLTTKQRLFVAAIVGPAAGNASKAAELAGYRCKNTDSLKATAHDILTSPYVQQAVRQALAKRKATAEWAQAELASIADGDLSRFLRVDAEGRAGIDWRAAMAAGAVGLIREIDLDDSGSPKKIRLHDRVKALETILRLYGKFVDKHEHTGKDGAPLSLIVDTALVKEDRNVDPQPDA